MRTIIAGSRGITDAFTIIDQVVKDSGFEITEVVSGTARGIDKEGEGWASLNNIPIKRFPASWEVYGRGAGHIRNKEMAEYADALIAIWDGKSSGTRNMINNAAHLGLKVIVHTVGNEE